MNLHLDPQISNEFEYTFESYKLTFNTFAFES
jgi:hypothetical protein